MRHDFRKVSVPLTTLGAYAAFHLILPANGNGSDAVQMRKLISKALPC